MPYITSIPKVDKILTLPDIARLLKSTPKQTILAAVRSVLNALRAEAVNGLLSKAITDNELLSMIEQELEKILAPSLHAVVNGTGVVIHTNLGRSLLAKSACQQMLEVAQRYSNLEMDMASGKRGERYEHVEDIICELTGAEAAIVVNNNAAAVFLTLSSMAAGKEVVVSRGELIEIGGSFRIPEVMKMGGCSLKEVGCTNKTHLRDYEIAISDETALLLKVHPSNFSIVGFTEDVTVEQLVILGKKFNLPVMADIGSGCLINLSQFGIKDEKPVQDYIKAGLDIITFSGDKMLGGPQAGFIVGKKELIEKLRKEQLLRALRIDKLTLAALEATLKLYRDERQAVAQIPTLRMLTIQSATLKSKASSYLRKLRPHIPDSVTLNAVSGDSQVGGGALPLLKLPTTLIQVAVQGWSPQKIDNTLRLCTTPVLGRIHKNSYLLDIRTLQDDDLPALKIALGHLK